MGKSDVTMDWVGHDYVNLTDHAVVRALMRAETDEELTLKDLQDLKIYDLRFAHEIGTDWENTVYQPDTNLLGLRQGKSIVTFLQYIEEEELRERRGKYEKEREDETYGEEE